MVRARAAVVAAVGGVEYTLPVASVSYILISASAHQDSTGLYQYKTEFATVADEALITFAKNVSDGVAVAEAIQNYVLEKGITDAVTLSETIDILIVVTIFLEDAATVADAYASLFETIKTETITTSDGRTWAFGKNQDETLSVSDVTSTDFSAAKTDAVDVTEANAIGYSKPAQESVTSDDSFDRVAEFSRDFDEPQTIAEEKALDLSKPIFDQRLFGTLNSVPVNTLAVDQEYLEDKFFVYATDTINVLLVIERVLADSISEPTDSLVTDVSKQLADTASAIDSLSYVVIPYSPQLFNNQVFNKQALGSSY